jgi:hypothetical protein
MSSIPRRTILIKAMKELGIPAIIRMGQHKFRFITNFYYSKTKKAPILSDEQLENVQVPEILHIPDRDFFASDKNCIPLADEITQGIFRPFSGNPAPLTFEIPHPSTHWTQIRDDEPNLDLKLIWEPARFCWVIPLIRAYVLTKDTKYVRSFWQHWHAFQTINKPYLGENWFSSQEVAIRLINWVMAYQIFQSDPASTPEEKRALLLAIYQHAYRIPCSIGYAKAQNNNHLLTEAAGLFTAGCLFNHLLIGKKWKELGWKTFLDGISSQIDPFGTYIQQSNNYHRLMLQTAFWMSAVAHTQGIQFPPKALKKLSSATLWQISQLDAISGSVSNLGHNDGSYLFPFTELGYDDYRPVIQTAARIFFGEASFPPGSWDEMVDWFLPPEKRENKTKAIDVDKAFCRGTPRLWVGMHLTRFFGRPAHADQLHADIWYQGEYIVRDPGTYRYTANSPWDNRLARAAAHNAVMVDDKEPMLWAGRFLWLDWYSVILNQAREDELIASHDGYKKMNVDVTRSIHSFPSNLIEITDWITSTNRENNSHLLRLHWLLPDWQWQWQDNILSLKQPESGMKVNLQVFPTPQSAKDQLQFQLIRAGKVLFGKEEDTVPFGWYSPSYNHLIPALSFRISITTALPMSLKTRFSFQSK